MTQKYVVLRKPNGLVRAQVFIAGSEPIEKATLKLQLADCSKQDAPAHILAETSAEVAQRPTNDWVMVEFEFEWPSLGDFDLAGMSILAEIRGECDELLYSTQVNHPIDLKNNQGYFWTPTVVVQMV